MKGNGLIANRALVSDPLSSFSVLVLKGPDGCLCAFVRGRGDGRSLIVRVWIHFVLRNARKGMFSSSSSSVRVDSYGEHGSDGFSFKEEEGVVRLKRDSGVSDGSGLPGERVAAMSRLEVVRSQRVLKMIHLFLVSSIWVDMSKGIEDGRTAR